MKRIVVVDTMGGLGDLLLAAPVIEAIARSHPEAETTVVTTAPWHVLLERDPRIHEVVAVHGRDADAVGGAVRPVLERLRPDKLLPSSDAVPERFELGTLPYELLAGVTAAVDFAESWGMAAVEAHEHALLARLLDGLAGLQRVTVHGRPRRRTGDQYQPAPYLCGRPPDVDGGRPEPES